MRGRASSCLLTFALVVPSAALAALGCSTPVGADAGSGGASSDASSGGNGNASGGTSSSGSGGVSPSGGQTGSGGLLGTGGGACGPCPGAACQAPVILSVSSDSESGQVNLAGLTATGEGLTIECGPAAGCSAQCVHQARLADGHYSVTLEATGALPLLVEFDIQNPTDCGCCGCCPGSHYEQVVLEPDPEADGSRDCCADLENDTSACGSCDRSCLANEACVAGTCVPAP